MLEFHKRSCTQHVFNHPTTIYLLQVPLGWKHPKIPTYPIAFFSYGQSKTMHIEYNLLQSIFISICISVYLCCLYFYIYIYNKYIHIYYTIQEDIKACMRSRSALCYPTQTQNGRAGAVLKSQQLGGQTDAGRRVPKVPEHTNVWASSTARPRYEKCSDLA